MALVAAHIFGVVVASVVHKENLVLAMISGRKRRARD
jgi:cytochrome b